MPDETERRREIPQDIQLSSRDSNRRHSVYEADVPIPRLSILNMWNHGNETSILHFNLNINLLIFKVSLRLEILMNIRKLSVRKNLSIIRSN